MTVVPFTLGHVVDVACAAPTELDGLEPDEPLAMPAIPGMDVDPEPVAEPDPGSELAGFATGAFDSAAELAAGCDEDASTTAVAATTRTAAVTTAISPAHHSRAAVPMADTRSDTRALQLLMAHSS